jgi:NTE family protein
MGKLGIAFGGGGARGAAHVGVLMELERLGIKPDLVTGTSIGGLVAAMVAAGTPVDDMAAFFEEVSFTHLYALPTSIPALSHNSKLKRIIKATIQTETFADLKLPLAVVTVDLVSRKEIILDEGDLLSAVLATMSIPVLLPPIERDGLVLIDGGILNNVPFDVARARGATYVIAIDLTNTAPFGTSDDEDDHTYTPITMLERALAMTRRRRTWQILSTTTDIISSRSLSARLAISQPELIIRPEMGTMGLFDFHRWQEGIERGRQAVLELEGELIALRNSQKRVNN